MKDAMRFEDIDKAMERKFCLQDKICPKHRTELQPVAFCEDVWGCKACHETWHIPKNEAAA
jgi:hypothetical protein